MNNYKPEEWWISLSVNISLVCYIKYYNISSKHGVAFKVEEQSNFNKYFKE